MWGNILCILLVAAGTFLYGRQLCRFAGYYREGRVSGRRLCRMAGRLYGIVIVLILGLLDPLIRTAPFMQTGMARGMLVFCMGSVIFIGSYTDRRYIRYLKRTDMHDLPPMDARHRSLSLWLTRGTYWLWPLPLGMVIGGLYTVFVS